MGVRVAPPRSRRLTRVLSTLVALCDERSTGVAAALPVLGSSPALPSAPPPHVPFAALAFAARVGGFKSGAGCVAAFERRASRVARATPSFDAGAKSGPGLG